MNVGYTGIVKNTLIIIEGLSCTGKSLLAEKISDEFKLPYFSKDMFKEMMFDKIGYSDRQWSQKLGRAAYDILFLIAEKLLAAGQSLILESNFKPEYDKSRFEDLKRKYPVKIIEVLCFAEGRVLFERFKERALSGKRHPGHVDHLCLEEQEKILMKGRAEPMGVGDLIEVETSDLSKIDYSKVVDRIRQKLD